MGSIVNRLNSSAKDFARNFPAGTALGAGIWLVATLCEKVYQKHRGPLSHSKSIGVYSLVGAGVALVSSATKSDFPTSVIFEWTVLSYLLKLALKTLVPKSLVKITVKKELSAIYLSLDPEQNIYNHAAEMRKSGVDLDSSEWKGFVQKAQGDFSLENLADLFAKQISDQVIYQENKSSITFQKDRMCISENNPYSNSVLMRRHLTEFFGHRMVVFSNANGAGKGEDFCKVLNAANEGFITCLEQKIPILYKEHPSLTLSKLVHWTVAGLNKAQESILKIPEKVNGEVINGCINHLGLVVFNSVEEKNAHCCFTSVGNSKLMARFPDGNLVDLTHDGHCKDLKDAEGELGRKYHEHSRSKYGTIPDLRNLTVVYLPLPKGTVLLPMTAGVYYNTTHEDIQKAFQKKLYFEAVEVIVNSAISNAATKNIKNLDDICCGWIEISS